MEKIKEIEKREFGFFFSHGQDPIMVRKKRFSTQQSLEAFIRAHNPLDCFVSVAYYDGDEWIGADLFFDLDSKENITLARADAETVYEVLLDDFGLKEVTMNFSGSKGYHIIATDKVIRELTTRDRREICDYLIGKYKVETLDTKASIDVKRLRRIEGTINSKSGKLCKMIKSTTARDALDELIYKHIAEVEGVDRRGRYIYLLVKIISENYSIDEGIVQRRIEEMLQENKLILYTDETGEYVRRRGCL